MFDTQYRRFYKKFCDAKRLRELFDDCLVRMCAIKFPINSMI